MDNIDPIHESEEWKPLNIAGVEHYQVSNYGRIYDTHRRRLQPQWETDQGYLGVSLHYYPPSTYSPANKNYAVHRLVALCFLEPAPTGKDIVVHKDFNKKNNHASNLEWASLSESTRRAVRQGKSGRQMTPVIAIPLEGGEELHFESQNAAAAHFGVTTSRIWATVREGYPIKGYWLRCPTASVEASAPREHRQCGVPAKAVILRNEKTGEEVRCKSQSEAARYLGLTTAAIQIAIVQNRTTRKGWRVIPIKANESEVDEENKPAADDFEPIYGPEHWVPINEPGLSHYEISDYGRIRNTKNNNAILRPRVSKRKYYQLTLSVNLPQTPRIQVTRRPHMLVALHFLNPPLPGQTMVNHKDCNKLNNHVSNLEWVTPRRNYEHALAHDRGGAALPKTILAVPLNPGGSLKIFNSRREAARYFGVSRYKVNHAVEEGYDVNGYWLRCPDSARSANMPRERKAYGSAGKPIIAQSATGEELSFKSIEEAAAHFNTTVPKIRYAICRGHDINDWWFYCPDSDLRPIFHKRKGIRDSAQQVLLQHIDTGETVCCASIANAAKYIGMSTEATRRALKNHRPIRNYWIKPISCKKSK